jgi:methionyl-tRNA formyltransferase
MDATYDTGDILMQTAVDVSQCDDEPAFIRQHALVAAQLFGDDALWNQHAIPQPHHGVSYAGHPAAADFVLAPHWTLARVRQFMRCTNARNHPYWVPQLKRWVTTFAEVEMLAWGQ